MVNKTRLIYWICVATIGFGNTAARASDDSNSYHCSAEKHEAFVNCYTTWDFTSKGNSVKGFQQCLEKHKINELEARECHREMVNNLKHSIRESINETKEKK